MNAAAPATAELKATDGGARSRKPAGTGIFARALCLAMALMHTYGCWQLLGGRAGLLSPYPILNHDHTFNYYYAVTTRHFLRQSGTTAGYDPSFMAGYAKSILFPSSSTLAEVTLFLFGGNRPERVYKLYVLFSAAALPWLTWLAAWLWLGSAQQQAGSGQQAAGSRPEGAARGSTLADQGSLKGGPWPVAVALVFFELYFWADWGLNHLVFGMVPFALSAPLALLAAGLVLRFLGRGGWGWWVGATLTACLACLTHASSAFAVAPGLLAAYLSVLGRIGWKRHLAAWAMLLTVMASTVFWLAPGVLLLSTMQGTATGIGFINPNVWDRMVEFFVSRPPVELTTALLAPVGLVLWSRPQGARRPASFWAMTSLVIWNFLLGYFAGLSRDLDFLQPGRYTLYFFTWGALPAGLGAVWLLRRGLAAMPSKPVGWLVAAMLGGAALAVYGPGLREPFWPILRGQSPVATAMPALHQQLIDRLKALVRPGERILFEERNRGITLGGRLLPDPLGDIRLSPLLPLYTGAEVIGGPYLHTHLKTNFTQFGDGLLMDKSRWTPQQFAQYAHVYNVQWIVCWSPYARTFCRSHPELVTLVEDLGGAFLIGRVRLDEAASQTEPSVIRKGTATVEAPPGRLVVKNIQTRDGVVVLPYHWVPRLATRPQTQIEPIYLLDDPVPFIGLRDPPPQVELWIKLF